MHQYRLHQEMHYKKDWEEGYKSKLVSADNAVKVVKSGDYVFTPLPPQPLLLQSALAQRASELKNVTVQTAAPVQDPGWFSPGIEESFNPVIELFIAGLVRLAHDDRRTTYSPVSFSTQFKTIDENRPEKRDIDVFMTCVSPPDKNGFCYLGPHMWHKRSYAKRAKKVIVEVDANIPKMYGDNALHISEIDYFVENTVSMVTWEECVDFIDSFGIEPPERRASVEEFMRRLYKLHGDMMGMFMEVARGWLPDPNFDIWSIAGPAGVADPAPSINGIAENLNEIIQDGDCFQIGVGRPGVYMVDMGVFDQKHDLSIYTEMGAPGMALLVKRGIVTGKCQTFHTGKAVFSTLTGCGPDDIEFAADNPMFEVYDSEYVVNIANIAKVENIVAINNGLQVDLTGQICSETQFGPRMINGQGGQLEFHIGSFLAKGGRACTLLPSTALQGAASTIVAQLDKGSLVTIQRHFADIIVTEHGIARLAGKNHRERADELIGVAHPDFRAELRKEAQKLFYP